LRRLKWCTPTWTCEDERVEGCEEESSEGPDRGERVYVEGA
jgi:hypothetical protein